MLAYNVCIYLTMSQQIRMLTVLALVGGACDAAGEPEMGPAAVGGKADQVEGETEGDVLEDATEEPAAERPIAVSMLLRWDCGEMGDNGDETDDPRIELDEDEGELVGTFAFELPASCRESFSVDCRAALPSSCWEYDVSVRALEGGPVFELSGFAGDADSTIDLAIPLASLTSRPIELDVTPDAASGGFGSVSAQISAPAE